MDAVVAGGELGLELAEELDLLRPFGMGNPQPTLLVPAAQIENVAGMGEERQHARFTLVSAGVRARGVAFGATQKSLAAGAGTARHVAVRLEANRWNGAVEPRVLLRALCSPEPGTLRELGKEPFWESVRAELGREPAGPAAPASAGSVADRRGAGFAGTTGDLLSSGESVLVAVADVARRRASLEAIVAGMAGDGGLAVASWSALALDPTAAAGFRHLVALDPPPRGMADPLLRLAPCGHAAWGPEEAAFALTIWRAELELRPALTDSFRALRGLAADASAAGLESALRGSGAYPRGPLCCGRVLRILGELGLAELALDEPRCTLVEGVRSDLELSPSYRAYRARCAGIERALAAELPAVARAAPVARAS